MVETAAPPAPGGLLGRAQALALRLVQYKEFKRFSKFFVVGMVGFVIDFSAFNAINTLGWLNGVVLTALPGIAVTGVGIAGAISFTLAVLSNFVWNRVWVYPDSRSKPVAWQLVTFFLVNVAGILIRVPILELLSTPFGNAERSVFPSLNPDLTARIGENTALALAVIVVMFWNFFVNRYWTYSDVK